MWVELYTSDDGMELGRITYEGTEAVVLTVPQAGMSGNHYMEVIEGPDTLFLLISENYCRGVLQRIESRDQAAEYILVTGINFLQQWMTSPAS